MDICLEDIPSDSGSADSVGDSRSSEGALCLLRSSPGSRGWGLSRACGKPWGLGAVCGGGGGGGACGKGLGRGCANLWGLCWVCGEWVKGLGCVGGGWGACGCCCRWASADGLGKVGGGCWARTGLGRVLGGWGLAGWCWCWELFDMWDTVLDETLATSGLAAARWSGRSEGETHEGSFTQWQRRHHRSWCAQQHSFNVLWLFPLFYTFNFRSGNIKDFANVIQDLQNNPES